MNLKGILDHLKKCFGIFHIELDNSTSNTLIIAGAGRSGTTWLSEILNYDNEYRDIFEPFHSKVCKKPYLEHKFIREDYNSSGKIYNKINKILKGKIRGLWIDQFNNKMIIRKRLIKCIRANLFLKYIKNNFKEIPIIFIIRNPFAVINSKIKLNKLKGWNFPQFFDKMLKQKSLMNNFSEKQKQNMSKKNISELEKHFFQWSIQNYIPLKQFNKSQIHVVFYEDLVINPKIEIKKIYNFLGKEFDETILKSIKNPSKTSINEDSIRNKKIPLEIINSWKDKYTKEELKRLRRILKLFELDDLYDNNSIPSKKKLYKLMKQNETKK